MAETRSSGNTKLALRKFKDMSAKYVVTIGGLSVIAAVLLIMFYLFYVVQPLFASAEIAKKNVYKTPGEGTTAYLEMEEQTDIAARLNTAGQVVFFNAKSGELLGQQTITAQPATSFTVVNPTNGLFAYGLTDGNVQLAKTAYKTSYTQAAAGTVFTNEDGSTSQRDTERTITPSIEYPYGEDAIVIDPQGTPLRKLSVVANEDALVGAAITDNDVVITYYTLEESFDDEAAPELELEDSYRVTPAFTPDFVLVNPLAEWLYLANQAGQLSMYKILGQREPELVQTISLFDADQKLAELNLLIGGISLLASSDKGDVAQWFPVRQDDNSYRLENVRNFNTETGVPITDLQIEQRRKGFAVVDKNGALSIFYTTSGRYVLTEDLGLGQLNQVAISPRGNAALVESADGQLGFWKVHNEHPEISLNALWGEVWYESYPEAQYTWQSSSASNDFEPKFSLMPLAFGTLKAAFYAMLLALPLAIAGAIYTAYFMSPSMRKLVKPVIEIMEALPTVILGFLAGLWLAPLVEMNLAAIMMTLMALPIAIIAFGYFWQYAPKKLRLAVPEGWQAMLLIPVVITVVALAFVFDDPVEGALFAGNAPQWLTTVLGVDFDQRNSVVVGFAMGFAVIPTIFSITEDAVFGVPKHLTNGSLALGATPWQTLVRVVLPTASPGMFSAVMIGMGRAVGETMIVLMATGNTPIMDFNIFEGFRTLSANIAVEMPESEVGSSHYRILFLAGLVLFIFTFMFNTIAELVRQRLREKYKTI